MAKYHIVLLTVIVVFVIGVTLPSSYSEIEKPENKICINETISSGTYNSITIIDESVCIIENITVLKNVKILNAQFVRISNSNIEGSIKIKNSLEYGTIVIENSIIEKNVKMIKSDNNSIQIFGSIINKNVILKDQIIGEVNIDNSQIGQTMRVVNNVLEGSFEFESNTVTGNTIIKNNVGSDLIVLIDNTFGKNVKIIENNTNDTLEVTLNTIQGNLVMKNNNIGEIEIGENIIGKNLRIINNQHQGALSMYANEVNQNINISKNNMNQFFITGNTSDSKIKLTKNAVEAFFGCDNNSPEPIMKKNTLAGQPFDQCMIINNS